MIVPGTKLSCRPHPYSRKICQRLIGRFSGFKIHTKVFCSQMCTVLVVLPSDYNKGPEKGRKRKKNYLNCISRASVSIYMIQSSYESPFIINVYWLVTVTFGLTQGVHRGSAINPMLSGTYSRDKWVDCYHAKVTWNPLSHWCALVRLLYTRITTRPEMLARTYFLINYWAIFLQSKGDMKVL